VFVWHWYNTYNGQLTVGFLHGHVDQAGAIPSEHAAFPFLFFLFLRRQFGRPAYLVLLYVAGLAFSVMYLGQHYFVDILAGIAYAAAAYAVAMYAVPALFARLAGIRFSPALSEGRKALTRKEG
jgi:membrane-associated phospholipid phosphatase